MDYLIFLVFILSVFLFFYLIKIPGKIKRKKLYKKAFPDKWSKILSDHFPMYLKLPEKLQQQLKGHINVFLGEKNFVGYHGIEIDDVIRVTIAAQACLLLLNRKTNYYPHLTNILIYPTVFTNKNEKGEVMHGRLGESWHRGPVVLSWQHSSQGALNPNDGENVVMHEFAHQLDQENGPGDGLPILQHNHIRQWSQVLSKEYRTLKFKLKYRQKSLLNKYGATNPAEFFAVATEHFIEQPKQLKKKHPELYAELQKYYQINPLDWV